MLRLDEPVPTPSGWTTIGELRVGDWIFGADGTPVQVAELFAVDTPQEAYRLEFDDGASVEACADHLWLTFTAKDMVALSKRTDEARAKRRAERPSRVSGRKSAKFTASLIKRNSEKQRPPTKPPPTGTVRTTRAIVQTLIDKRGATNHAIPVMPGLLLPHAKLPLDPYLLGVWLGDGTTTGGGITTADEEIMEAFEEKGFTLGAWQAKPNNRAWSQTVYGLVTVLRSIGVVGNKHIPAAYLRASWSQRLELLCGLMDTDGYASKAGTVEFTTTRQALAEGVHELILSLGWKARVVEGRATLYGRDIGPKWDIKWTPSAYVFKLERKRRRQRLATRRTTKFRYVRKAERVPGVPMRCIRVDRADGLFLVGRSMLVTHNSTAMLLAALQYIDVPGYSAGIFRLTKSDMLKPDAILARASSWFRGSRAWWDDEEHSWKFPTGGEPASIHFGYATSLAEVEKRYQGSAFQFLGIDELGQWQEKAYRYLFSRLRRKAGVAVPLRMRASANPGGRGHEWVKRRFVEYAKHTTMGTDARKDIRAARLEKRPLVEPAVYASPPSPDAEEAARSIGKVAQPSYFVPSFKEDNTGLDVDSYAMQLARLDPVTRKQLDEGDWDAAHGGNYFQPQWFKIVDEAPAGLQWVRSWDRAATEEKPGEEPDWTVGAKVAVERMEGGDRRLWIADVVRFREDPGDTERLIKATAETDGRRVSILIEQEPGSAGKSEIWGAKVRLLFGFSVHSMRKTGPKESYWKPVSSIANAGNVMLVRGAWNEAFIRELKDLPGVHDDQADSVSQALAWLIDEKAMQRERTRATATL